MIITKHARRQLSINNFKEKNANKDVLKLNQSWPISENFFPVALNNYRILRQILSGSDFSGNHYP